MKKTLLSILSSVALASTTLAGTTTITFNYGADWAHNPDWQTDFDTAEVDVQIDPFLYFYGDGWNDLDGAAWTDWGQAAYIDLVSVNGAEVTLESFDLANWYGFGGLTQYQVFDLSDLGTPLQDVTGINVPYSTTSHPTFTVNLSSTTGFRLLVGPDLFNMGVSNIIFSTIDDSDGDGIPDNQDLCPDSILNETIVIGNCDSGVANLLTAEGCTLSDLIEDLASDAKNHGAFVSGVTQLANSLKKDGIISGKEAGKLKSCAAKSK